MGLGRGSKVSEKWGWVGRKAEMSRPGKRVSERQKSPQGTRELGVWGVQDHSPPPSFPGARGQLSPPWIWGSVSPPPPPLPDPGLTFS